MCFLTDLLLFLSGFLLHFLEHLWVFLDLPLHCLDLLAGFGVLNSDLVEDLSDHFETVDLLNVVDFSFQILLGQHSDLVDLIPRVLVVVHPSSVGESIVHRQLLLQISDLLL